MVEETVGLDLLSEGEALLLLGLGGVVMGGLYWLSQKTVN